ncbi:hypothetical protein B0T26DRAFT_678645 [Lasiosphaeria miniovina]|uniref:DUF8021 domain-containing protein n=1 Tax=Lasiosphaeria miniovina TaxID=1954250 RepID=A0AA40A4M9_9PEZI|nr:uncharacterized protein B0T26DRAFT_678645 [Lasiosphaeria miniovina]KAK0709187.1 hypothetical protein B0T26DRAFT_678645 [Lasiosphaeria miniovina]
MAVLNIPAALAALAALAAAVVGSPLGADCSRSVLLQAADAYVAAQTAGRLDPLRDILDANWVYQENNAKANATKGVLSKALKIDHRRTNVDMTACATYTELISTDAASPYVIGTQIHHSADNKVTLIDSVASTTNSWIFDAKKTLQYVLQETWDPIPVGKQDKREVIQAAGDAYLDMWLEGSAYTGKGKPDDSCKPGIPSNSHQAPNTHRRYVIDESMGSVNILCVWEHMMMAADSHEFRLEGGKLRYVHTLTPLGLWRG